MKRPAVRKRDQIAPAQERTRSGDRREPLALPADDFDRDVWCVLGIPIDRVSLASAVVRLEASVRDRKRLSFVTPNVNWLVRALRQSRARRQILDADLSLADGAPIVLLSRLLGVPLEGRAAGADLFEALRRRPGFAGRRMRVFFFGGREDAARRAFDQLNAERGGLEGAGWTNPGFGDVEAMSAPAILRDINAAGPDFVVVSLGAAKGQEWIARNQFELEAPVIAHLGAVVDFTAGSIRRAPALVSRLGFEWAFRIVAEPALWRRYLSDAVHLAGFALTRLGPQLLVSTKGRAGASIDSQSDRDCVTVRPQGDMVHANLGSVRVSFRTAAASGRDIILDLTGVRTIDRAFLGLVLMLEKRQARQGGSLAVTGMNRGVRTLFRGNMMNYAEPEARAARSDGRAAQAG
ncbi:MAG: WecB/TagA/CpsF family glycosyltransferase [Parvularculaceae bacterium]